MSSRGRSGQQLRQAFADGLRVGLTGPAGTGKTTFSKYLESNFGAVVEPERVATWLENENLPNPHSLTASQELRLQNFLFQSMECSSANVFDRFGADRMFFAREAKLPISSIQNLNERAIVHSHGLDVVVYFPFYWRFLRDDGFRNTSAAYQNRMAASIFSWLLSAIDVDRCLMIYDHRGSLWANSMNLLPFSSSFTAPRL